MTEETPTETAVTVSPFAALRNTATQSFTDLMAGSSVVEGYALTDKENLLGHPFIITGVTFRMATEKAKADYVSIEAVDIDNAALIFNDGSTGIRRQVVLYLTACGLIDGKPLADPDNPLCVSMDQPIEFKMATGTALPPLRCPRGLRKSDYVHPEFGDATTYYLG